jgi:tyrosinase
VPRKNLYDLSTAEWQGVVTALQGIKSSGVYDDFTRRHNQAMMTLTRLPGESGTSRNVAHRGPAFLPWHRQALYELEAAMQAVVPGVMIPYWRWDRDGSGWRTAKIWTLVGGNGSSSQSYRITTGPFKDWVSVIANSSGGFTSRAGIKRQFASSGMPGQPSLSNPSYDAAPWSEGTSSSKSFRQQLESPHNTVHVRIRGDMETGTSPNDPVFWLHHCNVDRIWAEWEARHGQVYAPVSGGPPGHNLNDAMTFLLTPGVRPADVLAPPAYA